MKHLIYSHARVRSLLGWLVAETTQIVLKRLLPVVSRLIPGRRGRRLAGHVLVMVGLVAQAFMLVLLAELVELCISLYEVWAILARKYVELS